MYLKKLPLALLATFACAAAANATAISVSAQDVGKSYTVNYDGFSDGRIIEGLTGQATFTLTGVTGSSYSFNYDIANTSSDPIDASRISLFGFNTDPNISSASSTGEFDNVATNSNVPSGFGKVDLCFKGSGGPNCAGGGGTGVDLGQSASGTLELNFASALETLSLSDFFVRYQSIEGEGAPGSAIGRGTVSSSGGSSGGSTGGSSGGSSGGTPVPAPAALWLFAAGLAGVGLRYGRSRKA